MNNSKIIRMILILAAITVIAGVLVRSLQNNSMTLTEYEALQKTENLQASSQTSEDDSASPSPLPSASESPVPSASPAPESTLTGAVLNSSLSLEERITYTEGFYYEPISDALARYMTGVSYPAKDSETAQSGLAVTFDDLRYLHILHYDFGGNPAEGELVCNAYIAQDLVEIFYQLYQNEYQLESVLLIDEFNGDDNASMDANNTSCFNYRAIANGSSLSKHALGLAVDINPLYNPYISYEKDGTESILPAAALSYADRTASFPYKIDENDLCYKLFTRYGFTWGGNWNNIKDYQHFQKALPRFP